MLTVIKEVCYQVKFCLDLAVYIVLVALRITLSTCRYTMVFTFQPLSPNIPYLFCFWIKSQMPNLSVWGHAKQNKSMFNLTSWFKKKSMFTFRWYLIDNLCDLMATGNPSLLKRFTFCHMYTKKRQKKKKKKNEKDGPSNATYSVNKNRMQWLANLRCSYFIHNRTNMLKIDHFKKH